MSIITNQFKTAVCWLTVFTLLVISSIYLLRHRFPSAKSNPLFSVDESTEAESTDWPHAVTDQGTSHYRQLAGLASPLRGHLPPAATTSTMRPNVILAMADDLGWGDVQYNKGNALTPNLNRMAHSPNSILLQRYYSGGPVCSPTRGTLLTGRNHNRYCVWTANYPRGRRGDFVKAETMPLPLSEITVAEVMREAGYSTALFGKWHLGDFKPLRGGNKKWPVSHPGHHGFEQWLATERSTPTCDINCGCKQFQNSTCVTGHYGDRPPCTNYYTNKSADIEGWPVPIVGDDSHFIWSLAADYIRDQVKSNKPFFLFLPFHTVHDRYIATEHYRDIYLKKNYSLDEADYYGAISAMDEVIGLLRELLDELGIKSNTLLWFSSDNGPAGQTPGRTNGLRGKKFSLYEGGVRVPSVIEWPDVIRSNKESWFPVVSNDVLPTIYDMLNIQPKNDYPIDGISILPFLQGKVSQRNQSIYWAFNINGKFNSSYSISTSGDRYKLMVRYENGKSQHYELFDLVNDLTERSNLSGKYPAVSKKLLTEVEAWRQSVMKSVDEVGCLGVSHAP